MRLSLRVLYLPLFGLLPLVLTGCTLSLNAPATPEQGMAIEGRVMGRAVAAGWCATVSVPGEHVGIRRPRDGRVEQQRVEVAADEFGFEYGAGYERGADQRPLLRDQRQQRQLRDYGRLHLYGRSAGVSVFAGRRRGHELVQQLGGGAVGGTGHLSGDSGLD